MNQSVENPLVPIEGSGLSVSFKITAPLYQVKFLKSIFCTNVPIVQFAATPPVPLILRTPLVGDPVSEIVKSRKRVADC